MQSPLCQLLSCIFLLFYPYPYTLPYPLNTLWLVVNCFVFHQKTEKFIVSDDNVVISGLPFPALTRFQSKQTASLIIMQPGASGDFLRRIQGQHGKEGFFLGFAFDGKDT